MRNPFEETDDDAFLSRWRTTQAVNLESAAHLTLLALPAMRAARFGRIVMVASRAAFRAETDAASYAVSKAGMVSLARCLARNEGPRGITANSICPGWVDTAMARPDVAARKAEIEGGDPARQDRHARGLREGDPLLPFPARLLRQRHGPGPQRRLVPPLTAGLPGPFPRRAPTVDAGKRCGFPAEGGEFPRDSEALGPL